MHLLTARRTAVAYYSVALFSATTAFGTIGVTRAMSSSSSSSSSTTTAPKKQGALIFLHGLGDTPAGWSSLEFQLPQIKTRLSPQNIEYIFPHAPTIPIDINGGALMPGWFSLFDWPVEVGCTDDKPRQLEGIDTINAEIDRLVAQGMDKKKIVVGGFSQGGAIALLAAYHQHSRHPGVGGCAALSGWLTLTDELQVPEEAKETPLFWAHGQYDDKVLFEHQAFGIHKLEELGVKDIESKSYRMGHSSDPDEISSLAAFVEKVVFGEDDKKSTSSSEL